MDSPHGTVPSSAPRHGITYAAEHEVPPHGVSRAESLLLLPSPSHIHSSHSHHES